MVGNSDIHNTSRIIFLNSEEKNVPVDKRENSLRNVIQENA